MDGWVTVHRGPVWQVELYQGLLADNGIDAFLPDATIKVMDPYATGALALDSAIQVRERDVEHAMRLLASLREERATGEDLDALALAAPPDPDLGISLEEAAAPDELEALGSVRARARDAIERLAARTRWASMIPIFFPIGIAYGFRYLGVSRRRGIRAAKHRLTLAAIGLSLLELLVVASYLLLFAAND